MRELALRRLRQKPCRLGRGEPAPFSRDRDRDDLVLFIVDRLDDRARRAHRDLVLAQAAAVDDPDPNLCRHVESRRPKNLAQSVPTEQLRAFELRNHRRTQSPYRIDLPRAERISSTPSSAVRLLMSSAGLISTTSSASAPPASAIFSIPRCASL